MATVGNVNNYIRENIDTFSEKLLFNKIVVFVKDPLPEGIKLDYILSSIEKKVPEHLTYGIDMIYIGDFEEFHERDTNAAYKDGALYVTNSQSDEDDMIDDIVHEMAHACEESYYSLIYSDRKIHDEFIGKRKKLFDILKQEGYNITLKDFLNIEYSREFDEFLYKEVGYDKLTFFTMGLFVSPYGTTSYREYFANGFEHYFLNDPQYVKIVSPSVYDKIDGLVFMEL
jgi:hypothetical protein